MSPSDRKYRACDICNQDLSHGEVYICRACQTAGWHIDHGALYRNDGKFKADPDRDTINDPARGIIFALLAGAILWAIIALIIWRFFCG